VGMTSPPISLRGRHCVECVPQNGPSHNAIKFPVPVFDTHNQIRGFSGNDKSSNFPAWTSDRHCEYKFTARYHMGTRHQKYLDATIHCCIARVGMLGRFLFANPRVLSLPSESPMTTWLTTDCSVCNGCWQGNLLHFSHQPPGKNLHSSE